MAKVHSRYMLLDLVLWDAIGLNQLQGRNMHKSQWPAGAGLCQVVKGNASNLRPLHLALRTDLADQEAVALVERHGS